jgi:hypothetical protein
LKNSVHLEPFCKIDFAGTAIEDATKALAADPTYHKVYSVLDIC